MEFEDVSIPVPKTRSEIRATYRASEKGKATRKRERKAWRKSPGGKRSELRYQTRKRRNKPFVAWDGEGVTREDGTHDYLLLANSNGDIITSMDSLSTEEILDFCLDNVVKDTINVIYGASYDWNMWLIDFTEDELRTLYDEQRIEWRGYTILWRRGKMFHIISPDRKTSAIFYDVVSFFQTSFVKACDSYLGDEFEQRDMIVANKMLRSGFRAADLREIAEYNRAELVNLVKLVDELRNRLHAVDLFPSRWDGPGAIAVALMSREKVPEHMAPSPEAVMPAVRSAYFGGRFEIVKCGHVEKTAYEYDINSAYPWALLDVPSLVGGTWENKRTTRVHPFAIYRLKYTAATPVTFPQPLPCRYPNGATAYPPGVTGWYWSPEYDVARQYVKMYGGKLEVLETWVFTPATNVKPFAYVSPLYAKRRALKAAGDGAHVGVKLGLNSQYGKLAQQVGWRRDFKGRVHIPPYHQLEWAGYVTSKCRAEVLRAALPVLDRVIAWETDAVFTEVPLEGITLWEGLGEWEASEFASLTYLQSGTYFATEASGKEIERTRGVDLGQLTRQRVLSAMERGDTHVPASLTRFMTAGVSLQWGIEHWCRWETSTKQVSLYPDGKRAHVGCEHCSPGFTLGVWHSTITAAWAIPRVSCEYEVEWANPGMMSKQLAAMRQGHYEGSSYDD